MSAPLDNSGYWLPDDYVLKLTALEVGWLLMQLRLKHHDVRVNKRGPIGELVATTMSARLLEKLEEAMAAHEVEPAKEKEPR